MDQKPSSKLKLTLNRETLAELTEQEQTHVQGGMGKTFSNGPDFCHTIFTCARGGCK